MYLLLETGAKGKFSGGFDITAFGGFQAGKGMCIVVLYISYSRALLMFARTKVMFVHSSTTKTWSYISRDSYRHCGRYRFGLYFSLSLSLYVL